MKAGGSARAQARSIQARWLLQLIRDFDIGLTFGLDLV